MDAAAAVDRARERNRTELDRLGTDKALLAATHATLESPAVLGALARHLAAGADLLADWAVEATDEHVAEVLETGAETLRTRADALRGEVSEEVPEGPTLLAAPGPENAPASDAARVAAGLIAVPAVCERLALQGVSFFVNEADTGRADACRDTRGAMDELGERGLAVLEEFEGVEDAVGDGVDAVVAAAYERYVAELESMGLDPKPIC